MHLKLRANPEGEWGPLLAPITYGMGEVNGESLKQFVRQHARTSALMGVDFVPISPGLAAPETLAAPHVQSEKPARQVVSDSTAALATGTHTPSRASVVEPKPLTNQVSRDVSTAVPTDAHERVGPLVHPLIATDPERASAQRSLDALLARYEADAPHKSFVTDHHCIVFGEGDPKARLMFIGEAPGADEDRLGRPFVGRSGQLLDKMIAALGLSRQDVYICNVMKTRPPNNATPTLEEAALCAPYLYEQIAIIDPAVIVTLGLPATKTVLKREDSMSNMRGRWWSFEPPMDLAAKGARVIPVVPTYHPAFLLRSYTTENRQKVWSDLKMAATKIATP